MDIVIMYFLMLCDLLFTFFNYKEAEELNPLFQKLLYGDGHLWFIFLKLGLNTMAAYGVIIIRKYKKTLSIILTLMGILVYGIVFYMHIEVYHANNGRYPIIPGFKEMLFITGEAAEDFAQDLVTDVRIEIDGETYAQ